MNEIFLSYATEDRARARTVAAALRERSWDVWWDREIPLGKAFDEVIEKAIDQARCVIVLWSAASVASEWVRNEASEGKRRGILLPVFIDPVEAPLAFRSLNGADLSAWDGNRGDPEFLRLVARVNEMLGQAASAPAGAGPLSRRAEGAPAEPPRANWATRPAALGAFALIVVVAGWAGYFFRGGERPGPAITEPAARPGGAEAPAQEGASAAPKRAAEPGDLDMEKRIHDLVGSLGAIPATSLARGFHVPDLGMRIAFLTPEQSASTLGAMPPGAVVMEVESGRPMAKAGIHVGDVVLSIAGKKIASEDDLRQAIFKIGPGRTEYAYRRAGDVKTVAVECPGCKVE